MLAILQASFLSVAKLLLVCSAGAWFAHRGYLSASFRKSLSQLVVRLMLPCLLVAKLCRQAELSRLTEWAALPVTAVLYVGIGLLVAAVVRRVARPTPQASRPTTVGIAFGNGGYVPWPLVAAVAATATLFENDPGAADRGTAYISVFLIGYSPCLWSMAYPYLSHRPLRELKLSQIVSPPIWSALIGIAIGITPPLRALLVPEDAPLHLVVSAADLIGQGTIPCALIILGANLLEIRRGGHARPGRSVGAAVVGRLLIMPLVGLGVTTALWRLGWMPRDPMCALVLMVESATPSATNLIVMAQVHGRGEKEVSGILLWIYLAAVPAMTFWVAVFLWVIG